MSKATQVKLLGADGAVKASISTLGAKGAISVEILDSSGNQITDFTGTAVTTPTTSTIYNVSMPLSDTEYSQAFPSGTKKFSIKIRSLNTILQFTFTAGESGTTYSTIPYGSAYNASGVNMTGKTIYLQSSRASQVVEVTIWT